MAKITVFGEATVITSSLKMEDIKKVQKHRPRALTLYGGEDGKEPIFCIKTTEKHAGNIDRNGATFGGQTHDDAGYATITLATPNLGADAAEKVAELIGPAIITLNKLEETIPAVLGEIDAERAQIRANIVVM